MFFFPFLFSFIRKFCVLFVLFEKSTKKLGIVVFHSKKLFKNFWELLIQCQFSGQNTSNEWKTRKQNQWRTNKRNSNIILLRRNICGNTWSGFRFVPFVSFSFFFLLSSQINFRFLILRSTWTNTDEKRNLKQRKSEPEQLNHLKLDAKSKRLSKRQNALGKSRETSVNFYLLFYSKLFFKKHFFI